MVKIAVIGCGLMGTKIAGELAYHGHRVKLHDANTNALNSAHERIEADKSSLLNDGLLPNENFVGQIVCLSSLQEAVHDAEFIFEAIVDDLTTKQNLFKDISQHCLPTAIISTNTLHLDVALICDKYDYKERCLGLRFLFPVYSIPEVEITTCRYTSPDAIDKVHSLMERMGKTLFFRSGSEPMILTEEQREQRKRAHIEQVNSQSHGSIARNWRHSFNLSRDGGSQQHIPPDQTDLLSGAADKDCAICMDKARDCLLCPCHHLVTCTDCAQSLLNRHDGCPICRKEISQVIHIYHS